MSYIPYSREYFIFSQIILLNIPKCINAFNIILNILHGFDAARHSKFALLSLIFGLYQSKFSHWCNDHLKLNGKIKILYFTCFTLTLLILVVGNHWIFISTLLIKLQNIVSETK